MSDFISIPSQDEILSRLMSLKDHKGLVLILGPSGSGKSALLKRFATMSDSPRIVDFFKNSGDFEQILNPHLQKMGPILLDEVGMYDEDLLEKVRIYSDERLFILSSHKKWQLFQKEHFKSRIVAEFKLLPLSYEELKRYIKTKYFLHFERKDLHWIGKICHHNLRTIDKLLVSFKELSPFCDKSLRHILRLSALDNNLLA